METKICPNCGQLVEKDDYVCYKCGHLFDYSSSIEYKNQEVKNQKNAAKKLAEENRKAALMAKIALNDLYEYIVVSVRDNSSGGTDITEIAKVLGKYSQEGWRLVNTFTNELGVNSSSVSFGGISAGTNATIDQTIMIFERCIKRYTREYKPAPDESSRANGENQEPDSVPLFQQKAEKENNNQSIESTAYEEVSAENDAAEKKKCPDCGAQNRLRAMRCAKCGYRFR